MDSLTRSETSLLRRLIDDLRPDVEEQEAPYWTPLPGPQTHAIESEADELFYGGAAGGGKTDLIIGTAFTHHRRAIIFRREFPQLRDVIDRGDALVEHIGRKFNFNRQFWRLPGDKRIEVGAVALDGDLNKYKGRAHDLKAFDEVTDFTERQYRFLIGWNRTIHPHQRVRVIAAGNPPTSSGGQWVIRYWAPWLDPNHQNPAKPGELRWFVVLEGKDVEVEGPEPFDHQGEMVTPKSRTFIPARLTDNPFLMATGYSTTLQGLPEPLRSQLLYGDFDVGLDYDTWQVIPTEWVRMAQDRYRLRQERGDPLPELSAAACDVARGGNDETVICRLYDEVFDFRGYPGRETRDGPSVVNHIVHLLGNDGYKVPLALDLIGVGGSVYDICRTSGFEYLIGFDARHKSVQRASNGRIGFVNLRAQVWWRFREALDPESGHLICLPPDQRLMTDLTAPHFEPTVRGYLIESKSDMERSTDYGDAAVMAWYAAFGHVPLTVWVPDVW